MGYRVVQSGLAGATADAIQRAGNPPAIADHVGDPAIDDVGLAILAAGDPIAFAGMGEAKHHDAVVCFQNLATTGGLVMQANEIAGSHCLNSLCEWAGIQESMLGGQP
ncbi:hypothetical protein D9M71_176420 [compost metagenome]